MSFGPPAQHGTAPETAKSDPQVAAQSCDAGLFITRLNEQIVRATSPGPLLKAIAELLGRECAAAGVWMAGPDRGEPVGGIPGQSGERERRFLPLLDRSDNPLWPVVGALATRITAEAVQSGRPVVGEIAGRGRVVAFGLGIPSRPDDEALIAAFPASVPQPTALFAMGLAANAIIQWRTTRLLERSGEQALGVSRLLGAIRAVSQSPSAASAAVVAVNQLQSVLSATQVIALARTPGGQPGVLAVSGVETVDPDSPVARAACSAARAIPDDSPPLVHPAGPEAGPTGPLAEIARQPGMSHCLHVQRQMPSGERIDLIAGLDASATANPQQVQSLAQSALLIAQEVALVRTGYEPGWTRSLRLARNFLRRRTVRLIAAAVAAFGLFLLIPWPWHISCQTRLEPVSRRFVTAPFEATLEQSLARNGDTVRAGDVIAILDGRALRMEMSAMEAELAAARKKRDSSLAAGNVAEAQVARNDCLRAEARLELINQRLQELEIRAPVDGVIVSGDLETARGATLRTGQTLFEIGPLDQIRAEIMVPESEIRHVRLGAPVRVKLEAWPFEAWQGTIARIHPRSEIVDDRNCFIAEVELDNPAGRMRPGMKGHGGVRAGWYPIGWIWTHRIWDRMRYLFVW